ncbi:MAG: class I SAM-dependent methyltransferase [Chloroflexi bacterium]|nr:class I SAM-dependent methyltransferase [Chloroflexota bacterium]
MLPQKDQTDSVLRALREQVQRRADDPEPTPGRPALQSSLPPLGDFLRELDARWRIAVPPFGGHVPVLGPLLARFWNLWNRAAPRLPVFQQQIDFNASTVRFAQRVERELTDLGATIAGLPQDSGERDRALVDLQREVGALRVRLRQQQRHLEEAERLLASLEQESRLLARRVAQDRRPVSPPAVDGPAAPAVPRPEIDYYRFELRFRGTPDQIREHQRQYVPYFAGAADVLDIGCGRGEFLELLREAGVSCRGVDLDRDMVAACHEKGLEVVEADALAYLRAQEDGSLGGAFTAQLVEHLEPGTLVALIDLLGRKLRPGAPVVIETINPLCLLAANSHFLLDLSHVRLVHPETLKFLLEGAGFSALDVRYTSPVPEEVQLEGMPSPGDGGPLDALCRVHNRNMQKINGFLYGYQDYAVVGLRE